MRYAPEHKVEARAKILAAAGRGFRKHGYGGIGVDGLAKEAEVTSGAFYGHFPSKEEAFREVLSKGVAELREGVEALRAEHGARWVGHFVDFYLGHRRVCDLSESCALQSLAADVQRADEPVKATFELEFKKVVQAVAEGLQGGEPDSRKARAEALLSLLSGGVTIARSVNGPGEAEHIAGALREAALAICRPPRK